MDQTLAAMRAGADVIVQGAFIHDGWGGRTDILKRVEKPSALGAWSYEVIDTKLARRTKGATLLQLCVYSELSSQRQGRVPEYMHVVKPGSGFEPESFRTASFAAYYRWAKRGFARFLDGRIPRTRPTPSPMSTAIFAPGGSRARRVAGRTTTCAWSRGSQRFRSASSSAATIDTTTALAGMPHPDLRGSPSVGPRKPTSAYASRRGSRWRGGPPARRSTRRSLSSPELGLTRLPAPSAGDIFFDFEGDPFVDEGGLEYLFGYVTFEDRRHAASITAIWALTARARKSGLRAVRRLRDGAVARRIPDLHIYHYAPYEPSALKRLMGRYATREEEIDRMLRGRLFVDLYQVVRQGIRASVERYSIKELESLFGFVRGTPLEDASGALATVQALLETGDPTAVTENVKAVVPATTATTVCRRGHCGTGSRTYGRSSSTQGSVHRPAGCAPA